MVSIVYKSAKKLLICHITQIILEIDGAPDSQPMYWMWPINCERVAMKRKFPSAVLCRDASRWTSNVRMRLVRCNSSKMAGHVLSKLNGEGRKLADINSRCMVHCCPGEWLISSKPEVNWLSDAPSISRIICDWQRKSQQVTRFLSTSATWQPLRETKNIIHILCVFYRHK